MPKLVIHHGTAQAWEYELKPGINTVGRGPASDLRIEEASVSVAHAQIILDGGSVTVKDLGSTNGTFISRSQIREGFLQPGQILQLGRIELLFHAEAPAAEGKSGGFAPTIALPQVGGMKVIRPVQTPSAASFKTGGSAPSVPAAPAPVGAPTRPATSAPVAPAPQPQRMPSPAPVFQTAARLPAAPQADAGVLFRCLAFGAGAALLAGVLWIAVAALTGATPAPYACAVAGLFAGLAMMLARDGRRGLMFSLMAVGFCLLAVFLGQIGQAFAIHQASFTGLTIIGLLAGLVLAWLLGGGMASGGVRRRPGMAG